MSEEALLLELTRKVLYGLDFTMAGCPQAAVEKTARMVVRACKEVKGELEVDRIVREGASPAVAEALDELDSVVG